MKNYFQTHATTDALRWATILLAFCITIAIAAPAVAASFQTKRFLSHIDGGTGKKAIQAYLDEPYGLDIAENGDIFHVDTANNKIEKIDSQTSKLTLFSGTGQYGFVNGLRKQAQYAAPYDLAVRGNGSTLFVADTENNVVRKIQDGMTSTFRTGLNRPKGVALHNETLYISDTNNNRILSTSASSSVDSLASVATGLDLPTKLRYCPALKHILFINSGDATLRALDTDTGTVSDPLFTAKEDLGGVYCDGHTVYIVSSHSIGVFNQLWRLRMKKEGKSVVVTSKKLLSNKREVAPLNFPSDIEMREDTTTWEDYYSWKKGLLYEYTLTSDDESVLLSSNALQLATGSKKSTNTSEKSNTIAEKGELACFDFKQKGESSFRDTWYMPIDTSSEWQTEQFELQKEHQGDQPFFRVSLQYDDPDVDEEERLELREENTSEIKDGGFIQSLDPSTKTTFSTAALDSPTNLNTPVREPREITLGWDAADDAATYNLHFFQGNTRLYSKKGLTGTSSPVKKFYIQSNQAYSFRVQSCNADGSECGDFSELYEFRTPPGKVVEISDVIPITETRMSEMQNGNFLTTLRFRIRNNTDDYRRENLRAQVQLCSYYSGHKNRVKADRLYVTYKGGSSIIAWKTNGKHPEHYAGKHRFQNDFGSKSSVLIGRPKAIAFSSDGSKMYISQNNKITKYNFKTNELQELAGNVMDSYVEGTGPVARFSDVVDMVISPDDEWLFLVDRNNHRIRKLNTRTGKTKYITGAGGTNFAFKTLDSNGYAEGKACNDEFDQDVSGCAYFNRPTGIAVSPNGNWLYIAEGSNNRIRKVDANTGKTSLIAGDGDTGFTDGVGSAAQFNGPYTLDISSDGQTLYVADKYNHAIRQVDLATNTVTTVFGKGNIGLRDGKFSDAVLAIPEYIREDNGVLYWSEAGSHTVRGASLSSETVFTISGNANRGYENGLGADAEWNNPKGMELRAGILYVADYANDMIRTIDL